MNVRLVEVVDAPENLQEVLRETVKWLDLGDQAIAAAAALTGEEYVASGEIQTDLLAVADLLDSTPEARRLGHYLWTHRFFEFKGDDDA